MIPSLPKLTIKIVNWPLPHSKIRPNNLDVEGIIIHSMGEWISTEDGDYYAVDWLDKLGYSAHAFIAPDGKIIKSVDENRISYHAGESKLGNLTNLNTTFLGVEVLAKGKYAEYNQFLKSIKTSIYTPEQYKSLGWLCAFWNKKYPKIKKETMVGHNIVSGDNIRGLGKGKRDPGEGFNWKNFFRWYNYYINIKVN